MIRVLDQSPIDGSKLRRDLTELARAHAGDESALRAAASPILREAWRAGRKDVRKKLEAGAGGIETARSLSRIADEIVSALFDFTTVHLYRARNPTEGERLSVCAGGGYGRGELAPFSDLDLHFLRAYKLTPWVESVIETMLYALFDLGVVVGNSARTVEQAVRLSKEDWVVFTNLFDLRRIAGDADLPQELSQRLRDEVMLGRAREFVTAKLTERDERLVRVGQSRYMVEPDVKSGKGGLRDLQTLDWLARGVAAGRGESAAVALMFRREEARRFEYAADFLWRVRCFLHFAAGRAQERLTFDLQPEVAALMGFTDTETEPAVERFMRQYFLVARDVGALTRILCAKLEAEEQKAAPKGMSRNLSRGLRGVLSRLRKTPVLPDPRFRIEAGRVAFAAGVRPETEPSTMIGLFNTAARENFDVHPDALALVDRALDRMDDHARREPQTIDAFLEALLSPHSAETALRMMNEAGLLGTVVPEFGGIVGRTQFNMYHHFTVDEHTIQLIGGLAGLETGELGEDSDFAAGLYDKVGDSRRALYLAALLHDTGKGKGDQQVEGAKLAREAGERLGLDPAETDEIAWLVGHHLLMSDVAQRRDLSDPRTVAAFAAEVETTERLRLLTLLTMADIRAVGPGVWTPWKRRLIQDLYSLTEATFRGERANAEDVRVLIAERAEVARAALLASTDLALRAFTEQWTKDLEDSYWLQFPTEAQRRHRDFAAAAAERGTNMEVDAHWNEAAGGADLMVLTPDRRGVFAAVAGAIARSGGDVRAARIYTTPEGLAVDFFSVAPPEGVDAALDENWLTRLREGALAAARGETTAGPPAVKVSRRAAAFEIAPSVAFDDDASHDATIIEVSGRDRPGLLAALSAGLADLGVSVVSANVESIGERAMDVFYAVEGSGGKIMSPKRREAIKERLLSAFAAPEAPTAGGKALARAKASSAR
jgi:[protein-PII] uridylyltransferase